MAKQGPICLCWFWRVYLWIEMTFVKKVYYWLETWNPLGFALSSAGKYFVTVMRKTSLCHFHSYEMAYFLGAKPSDLPISIIFIGLVSLPLNMVSIWLVNEILHLRCLLWCLEAAATADPKVTNYAIANRLGSPSLQMRETQQLNYKLKSELRMTQLQKLQLSGNRYHDLLVIQS